MRFLYCKECNNLRPRGWFLWTKRCETCFGEMISIDVPMTRLTPIYYAVIAMTMLAVGIFISDYDLPFGVLTLVALVILMFALAFVDYVISYERARRIVDSLRSSDNG